MALPAPSRIHESDAVDTLHAWLRTHQRIFVLTGAGISTNSGIPDYRGPDGQWKRKAPITYQDFVRDPLMRARYWARSFVGWPTVARATPNRGHTALVALEAQGRLATLVTQNVDGLHARAGHRAVIDLHGRIDTAVCLACRTQVSRDVRAGATRRGASGMDGSSPLRRHPTATRIWTIWISAASVHRPAPIAAGC